MFLDWLRQLKQSDAMLACWSCQTAAKDQLTFKRVCIRFSIMSAVGFGMYNGRKEQRAHRPQKRVT